MSATDYIKIYHNNGRHVKIGSGRWPKAREEAAAALSRHQHPLRGDENIELEIWSNGQHTSVKSKDWREILAKMGDTDASTTIVFCFAMCAWVAAFQLLLPVLGGVC